MWWFILIAAWLITAVLFMWVYASGMATAPQSNNWRDFGFFGSLGVSVILTAIKGSLLMGGEWWHGLLVVGVILVVLFFHAMSKVRWL